MWLGILTIRVILHILSTYTQVSRLFEAFENNSSANIKLLKISI